MVQTKLPACIIRKLRLMKTTLQFKYKESVERENDDRVDVIVFSPAFFFKTRLLQFLKRKWFCDYLGMLFFLSLSVVTPSSAQAWKEHGKLEVSENGHYLQHADGTPFPWIGDTGWALFSKLDRKEVSDYLDIRQAQGFNVIQAVIFWYPHKTGSPGMPHNATNAYGHRPFAGGQTPQTDQPLLIDGNDPDFPNDYWDHVDFVMNEIEKRGMYLAALPCWGSAFVQARIRGSQVQFDVNQARLYGQFLGRRYGNRPNIIWVLGGDIDPVNHGVGDQRQVYRAMAEGIGRGATANMTLRWDQAHDDWDKVLMTFHAVQTPWQNGDKGGSSSIWFHDDAWLDINMMETWAWPESIYRLVKQDYRRENPVKPTIMGEGAYEYGKYLHECGWVTPRLVRQQGYHTFFGGATGYTYGAYPVWPMWDEECGMHWTQGVLLPGASQVGNVMKNFLMTYEWWKWEILDDEASNAQGVVSVLTEKNELLTYLPEADSVSIQNQVFGAWKEALWFNPENGRYQVPTKDSINTEKGQTFYAPEDWEDAILILKKDE
jgi:hypothetical protein